MARLRQEGAGQIEAAGWTAGRVQWSGGTEDRTVPAAESVRAITAAIGATVELCSSDAASSAEAPNILVGPVADGLMTMVVHDANHLTRVGRGRALERQIVELVDGGERGASDVEGVVDQEWWLLLMMRRRRLLRLLRLLRRSRVVCVGERCGRDFIRVLFAVTGAGTQIIARTKADDGDSLAGIRGGEA